MHRGADTFGVARVGWYAFGQIERTFYDPGARMRDDIECSAGRSLALTGVRDPDLSAQCVPLYSIPLTTAEAARLAAPYLNWLEARMEVDPTAHYALVWNVLYEPVAPFERVFRDWLADLDARGVAGGAHQYTFDRALALHRLTERGRQCLSWERVETVLLSELVTEPPLVAAALARFLGNLIAGRDARIDGAPGWPLPRILSHLAGLPRQRRIAAGGFLDGFGAGEDPFGRVAQVLERTGDAFDLNEWVLEILADRTVEPHLPSAQSFWFHVHEHFWNAPGFAMRLVDAGHFFVAHMCATEGSPAGSGMMPVLERLSREAPPDLDDAARAALACARK